MKPIPVLIVGAGPSGLLLAALLNRAGTACRIIDANEGPTQQSRAIGIQAKTLELMRNVGLVEKFLAKGMVAAGATLHVHGRERARANLADMNRPDTPYPFIYFLSQTETERILIDDLASRGLTVERGCAFERLYQDSDHVTAVLRHRDGREESIECAYLVGADGAHSRVRKELGIAFKGEAYAAEFIMADTQVEWALPSDRLQVFLGDGGVGVYFPLKGAERARVLTVRMDEKHEPAPVTEATTALPATLAEVETAFTHFAQCPLKLSHPVWVTRFRVHHRSAERVRERRAFLIGDASHIHSPVGAQGMNTGLQDAANLAWKLASVHAGRAEDSLLDTYASERWPVGQRLLQFTDRAFSLALTRSAWRIRLRNAAIPVFARLIMTFPAMRRRAFRFVSQLNIRYRLSEAAREDVSAVASRAFRETLPSGWRAPNACVRPGLEIFDLLVSYRFHRLVFSRDKVSPAERSRCEAIWARESPMETHWLIGNDVATEAFDRYGVTEKAIFVIRPDGHVGFRSDRLPC